MKHLWYFSIILVVFFLWLNQVSAFTDCSDIIAKSNSNMSQLKAAQTAWILSGQSSETKSIYSQLFSEWMRLQNSLSGCLYTRNSELWEANQALNDAIDYYRKWAYIDAIPLLRKYISLNWDKYDKYYQNAMTILLESLNTLGQASLNKNEYPQAISYLQESYSLDMTNFKVIWALGFAYLKNWDLENAQTYYEKALNYATDSKDITIIQSSLDSIRSTVKNNELQKNAPTNDTYSYLQYYLKDMHIVDAWSKVSDPKPVIVAVIDDGINVNHPDLSGHIWVNVNDTPWNGKDDDGNGYIDDYNGWNFSWDGLPNLVPDGFHGTMVAGIIGAKINNQEGIAGIAKNVYIMPLRVFPNPTKEGIIAAIQYAIDNGASIINLSLGGNQFKYSDGFDAVIKDAYNKGIVVVVAAGNGDVVSGWQSGVDTTVNKISPICNTGSNPRSIIGVGAFDTKGYRTNWSNYGSCVWFFAPWENIISTSIPTTSNKSEYRAESGTSFSAPIMAGIIALGYNAVWYVAPEVVYDTLMASTVKNSVGNYVVDASIYVGLLQHTKELEKRSQAILAILQQKFKKSQYPAVIAALEKIAPNMTGDNAIVIRQVITLLK